LLAKEDVLQAKAQGLPVNVFDTSAWKEGGTLEPGAFTLVWLDKSPHPNASKVFINWLLSREGQMAVQRDGEINDSLRVDISKTNLRSMARRKEGAKYMVTWKAGVDGCRADAKSGQPGTGEGGEEAIILAKKP
jgi:hypothetical protein